MSLKDKLERLKKSGIKGDKPPQKGIEKASTFLLFEKKIDENRNFSPAKFKKLFPLYLPFFPSAIMRSEEMLFLDIETTSLSLGAGSIPFLIGIGYFNMGSFFIRQLFLPTPAAEYDALKELMGYWQRATVVVTYNGKTFDIPFLKGRFAINRLGELDEKKQYDLYQLIRSFVKPATLHNAEEKLLGIKREEGPEGGEVPKLYFKYIESGDIKIVEPVFQRNLQDLLSLPALLYKWVELKNPLFFQGEV